MTAEEKEIEVGGIAYEEEGRGLTEEIIAKKEGPKDFGRG